MLALAGKGLRPAADGVKPAGAAGDKEEEDGKEEGGKEEEEGVEEEEEEVRSDSRRAELACARASRLKFIAVRAFNYRCKKLSRIK